MRLISCHIDGFGKLVNKDHNFSEGFNEICEENGWGKSTFSAFIKAMFYGLEVGARSKDKGAKKMSNREHYKPWDCERYGGSLVFEMDGVEYEVERSFGTSSGDDEYKIFNRATKLEVEEYKTEDPKNNKRLGDMIFEVDEESFMKSIYVSQNEVSAGITDSLSAKMGDISSARDDISSYENAVTKLRKKSEEYKTRTNRKKENRGRINLVDERIAEIDEALEQRDALRAAMDKNDADIRELKNRKGELLEQKQVLTDKVEELQNRQGDIKIYNDRKASLKENEAVLDAYDKFFANGKPDMEQLDALIETDANLTLKTKEYEEVSANRPSAEEVELLERLFVEEFDPDNFERWEEIALELKDLRAQSANTSLSEEEKNDLAGGKFYFAKKHPTFEEISMIQNEANLITEYETSLKVYEDAYNKKQADYDNKFREFRTQKNVTSLVLHIVAAVLLAGGIAGLILIGDVAGVLIFGVGVFSALIILIVSSNMNSRRKRARALELEALEEEVNEYREKFEVTGKNLEASSVACNEFLSNFGVNRSDSISNNLLDIQRRLDRYEHLLEKEKAAMEEGGDVVALKSERENILFRALGYYAECYGMNIYEDECEDQILFKLRSDYKSYLEYQKTCERLKTLKSEIDTLAGQLDAFLSKYPDTADDGNAKRLEAIRDRLKDYTKISAEVEALKVEIEDLGKKAEITPDEKSLDEYKAELDANQEALSELDLKMQELDGVADERAESWRELEAIATEREALLEERAELEEKYRIVEQTIDMLVKAKENFQAEYTKPLRDGLVGYVDMISGLNTEGFDPSEVEIDIDLNVIIKHGGRSRMGSDYLSPGYADMISLCARFALVDVLYKNEQPFMVLDDPLVNMDPAKISESIKLLKKFSKEKQIIYFTCHKSRV